MALKIRILPRWIIFLLDLFLIASCLFLSLVLTYNFHFNLVLGHGLKRVLLTAVVINAVLFYIFKSYAGIIRYTNIEDTSRLLIINLISAILYTGINLFVSTNSNYQLFPLRVVTINFFITNFVTISYRLFVRYAFKIAQLQKAVAGFKTKAAVYNTSQHGLHIKKVMNDLPNGQLQVIAFVDDSIKRGHHKLMESLPIYDTDENSLAKLKAEGVELIIIAENVTKEKLNELVDICLKVGIRVQQVPPMQDWLDGKLDTQQLRDVNIEDLLERKVIKIQNEKIHSAFKGKKILVTGAAGSIGSEVVRQLTQYRPSLIILCDRAESPLHELNLELQEKYDANYVKPYIGDISDRSRMEHLFEIYSPQIVFHAAAYKHVPLMEEHPSVAVLNNILGTKIIAELSVANDVEEFVMVSTDKAVNPTNIMGASKRIAEIFTQSFFKHLKQNAELTNKSVTKFVTTRFGNVLGSNGSVIPRFKQQLQHGGPITVTHPEITRYFMTIPEACRLVIEAGVMGTGGEIFVFDMGQPVKIADLAKKMILLSGKVPDVDIQITFTGLRPGEKLYEELLNNAENTMPTYHEKILIAQTREYDFYTVSNKINRLIESARKHYTLETVGMMKDLVPEFVSTNVAYEMVKAQSL